MSTFTYIDLLSISPMLAVIVTAMVVLMVDLWLPRDRKGWCVGIGIFGAVVGLVFCGALWNAELTGFGGTVVADKFSLLFQAILLVVVILSFLLSEKYVQTKGINYGEYYALMLFSTSGAMLMATSRELITIFVGLEVLSIALYVLSGFARTEARSEESAMKYFLLGSFSSGFFLYGIALVYGGTGTTRLDWLADPTHVTQAALASQYTVAGIALLIVGLGFKAGVVPFHSWTPDVYEGAPTSVTAFMSAGAKAGAFAAFVRVALAFLPLSIAFHGVIWVLAILTMIVGNVLAIVQTNIKRMLAYSSIAHAGYILVGVLSQNAMGHAGILFYILAYTFMNLGAFGVLILLARRGEELNQISDLQGLYARQPLAAAAMALFMLSLGGIPPSAGFMGKFYLFLGVVQAHQYGLAVTGLVASVIGAAYYLKVIYTMFFQAPQREYPTNVWRYSPGAAWAIGICAVMTLLLQIYPTLLYGPSSEGAASLEPAVLGAPMAATVNPPPAAVVPRVAVRAALPPGLTVNAVIYTANARR
jgi:NADH-quinone oxidoreductase subunit N